MSSILTFLLLGCLVLYLDQTSAICCPPRYCADCTPPTPYCGHGPCNIFGCACKGGCREPKDKTLSYQVVDSPAEKFKQMDTDGDWQVDRDEFLVGASRMADVTEEAVREIGDGSEGLTAVLVKEWEIMDKNGDGKISPDEFDKDLM